MLRLRFLHPRSIVPIGTLALLPLAGWLLFRSTVHAEEPPVQAAAKSGEKATFHRRNTSTANTLADDLTRVPEIDLFGEDREGRTMMALQFRNLPLPKSTDTAASPEPLEFQDQRWTALGLEPRRGKDCQISKEAGQHLAATARALRNDGVVTVPTRKGGTREPRRVDAAEIEEALKEASKNVKREAQLPALVQLLEAEADSSRVALVQLLDREKGPAADVGLARRALFDLSPAVREAAVRALAGRPGEGFRSILLDGLRHPWRPVADHAAEALVELRDRDALPLLKKLLDEPDPRRAIIKPGTGRNPVVRELVRVNHLRNCVLCHAPSTSPRDVAQGPVPFPGEELPVAYYDSDRAGQGGVFVRADITYLRQDFSVMQPVEKAAPWPKNQRFDFLVRAREATAAELEAAQKPADTYPQREAVRWAIAELEKGLR